MRFALFMKQAEHNVGNQVQIQCITEKDIHA